MKCDLASSLELQFYVQYGVEVVVKEEDLVPVGHLFSNAMS
jgi:hypothetical protein